MNALAGLRTPADAGRAEFRLRTLTPLYTGGIGQQGEHIHPSGLLGGVRRFSCLLAAAIGDAGFEADVWGRAGDARPKPAAKSVACGWDIGLLRECKLRPTVNWPRSDGKNRPGGWRFNVAHAGALTLGLTRRAISDATGSCCCSRCASRSATPASAPRTSTASACSAATTCQRSSRWPA